MDKEDIKLEDIGRILFGDAPPEFLLEVFGRTLVMYLALLLVLNWLGKRMNGELSVTEMAIMIMIGAMISMPMQMPSTGILQGILVLATVLVVYNLVNRIAFSRPRFENILQGVSHPLIQNGVILQNQVKKTRISRQQLYAVLRNKGIENLGQVERVYLEGCGLFSVYKKKSPQPGLPVYPPDDPRILQRQQQVTDDVWVCTSCGNMHAGTKPAGKCACGNNGWMKPYIVKKG
ncbi:MAG TPA: YetF domain-containing protein [Bacteroidia bacterium]|nr:YetF domain-containing protein [Bacteroidia bacterium]